MNASDNDNNDPSGISYGLFGQIYEICRRQAVSAYTTLMESLTPLQQMHQQSTMFPGFLLSLNGFPNTGLGDRFIHSQDCETQERELKNGRRASPPPTTPPEVPAEPITLSDIPGPSEVEETSAQLTRTPDPPVQPLSVSFQPIELEAAVTDVQSARASEIPIETLKINMGAFDVSRPDHVGLFTSAMEGIPQSRDATIQVKMTAPWNIQDAGGYLPNASTCGNQFVDALNALHLNPATRSLTYTKEDSTAPVTPLKFSPIPLQYAFRWNRLNNLSLDCDTPLDFCYTVLDACGEQLHALSLKKITASTPQSDSGSGSVVERTDIITMAHLRALSLGFSVDVTEFLNTLELPALEALELQTQEGELVERIPDATSKSIKWDALKKFTLHADSNITLASKIARKSPNLTHWTWNGACSMNTPTDAWKDICLPSLVRFEADHPGDCDFSPLQVLLRGAKSNRLELVVPGIVDCEGIGDFNSCQVLKITRPVTVPTCLHILRTCGSELQSAFFHLKHTKDISKLQPWNSALGTENLNHLTFKCTGIHDHQSVVDLFPDVRDVFFDY